MIHPSRIVERYYLPLWCLFLISLVGQQCLNAQNPPREGIDYRPLVFTAGTNGTVSIDSLMLGFPHKQTDPIELLGFQEHSPAVTSTDQVYVAISNVADNFSSQPSIHIEQRTRLILSPGSYYLNTSLGPLRILVLENNLSELQRLYRCFAFYTSITVHGRSAHDCLGSDALRAVFYTDYRPGNFCSGQVGMFQSIFQRYFKTTRVIEFFGFDPKVSDKNYTGAGHTVLEVQADGKWVLLDPMIGFIPFDSHDQPMSFLLFIKAKRKSFSNAKQFKLKYWFHVPIAEGLFLYAAYPPVNARLMSGFDCFSDNWAADDIIQIGGTTQLYMLKERFAEMRPNDWRRFDQHYYELLHNAMGPLQSRVRFSLKEDFYSYQLSIN